MTPRWPIEIAVPGSTSNLGPGFDALGLALRCYLTLRVSPVGDAASGHIEWLFGERPPEGENYIERGFRRLARADADRLPAVRVEVATGIPMKAGLGSSAAAIVAGLRLYEALAGPVPLERLLDEAAALEGHPDNTSASLLGGFVAACRAPDGRVAAVRMSWPADLRLVIATPRVSLETRVARRALPAKVDHADAVWNVQRTALLLQSIATGDRRWLREAFMDRLHQPHRAALVPGLSRALGFEHPSLQGVFLSGAGPSIAAVVTDDGRAVTGMFKDMYRELGIPADVRTLDVHQ